MDYHDDLGPATSAPFRALKPGDNPNKLNRHTRKGPRPRTKNSSEPPKHRFEHAWVDPLPNVPPIDALDMAEIPESIPAATVELDPLLPRHFAKPHCDLILSAAQNSHLTAQQALRVSNKLDALSHFKSARQLYSAMTDPEKSMCQPLKCVYYDSSEIPKHMAAAISMIGNFDSRIGRVEIANAPTLFRRWILQGLSSDPDIPKTYPNALSSVWRDKDGKLLVNRLAQRELDELATVDYVIQEQHLSLAPLRRAPSPEAYYTWIPDHHPNAEALRDLTALISQSEDDWIANAPLLHGRDFTRALRLLGLSLCSVSDSRMRDMFTDAMYDYIAGCEVHMRLFFNLGPAPQGSRGFAAQLVKSENNMAQYNLPLSDADRALGFLYGPCKSFTLNPSFVAFSRTRKKDGTAEFASRDATHFISG
jgi:hypothetical protein